MTYQAVPVSSPSQDAPSPQILSYRMHPVVFYGAAGGGGAALGWLIGKRSGNGTIGVLVGAALGIGAGLAYRVNQDRVEGLIAERDALRIQQERQQQQSQATSMDAKFWMDEHRRADAERAAGDYTIQ